MVIVVYLEGKAVKCSVPGYVPGPDTYELMKIFIQKQAAKYYDRDASSC